MKGIILAGGSATRLRPCTKVTSKHLLPVYNRPLIYYPLHTLLKAGIQDILIITAPQGAGQYLNLLGSGKEFGARFTYEIQDKPNGLAEAFIIGERFIDDDNVTLILGDNIYEDDLSDALTSFVDGSRVFAKKVSDLKRFGVVELDDHGKAVSIEEKPEHPKSNYCVTGCYVYDKRVIEVAKSLQPSPRGELEIVDLHNWYLEKGDLDVHIIHGEWIDAGTFDSLYNAQKLAKEKLQHMMTI